MTYVVLECNTVVSLGHPANAHFSQLTRYPPIPATKPNRGKPLHTTVKLLTYHVPLPQNHRISTL